ncbi:MAG: twin transmembrane helix small protein [Alphaproteobacteria bacterium]
METFQAVAPYLIYVVVAAVLGVLAVGVFGMLRGGPFNTKYGNKLMRARVGLQALAIALLALLLWLSKYASPPGSHP